MKGGKWKVDRLKKNRGVTHRDTDVRGGKIEKVIKLEMYTYCKEMGLGLN